MVEVISNMVQVNIASRRNNHDDYLYLLLKRADTNKVYPSLWQVITGMIEPNETAIQTALRELREETGLKPLKFWALPYISSFYDYQKNKVTIVPVFGILTDFIENIHLSNEHQDFKWATFDECLKILPLPQHIEAMKIFKDFILEKQENPLFQVNIEEYAI